MDQDEFAEHVAKSEVLEAIEVMDIFINYCSIQNKPLLMFPVKPRASQIYTPYNDVQMF